MHVTSGLFVTGTDTGVGKTVVSALLCAAIGPRARYYKPVQTGDEDDTATVQALAGATVLAPAYRLPLPAAPLRAAEAARRTLHLSHMVAGARGAEGFLIVEGAGGLLVPVTRTETTRDLIAALGLPALVVAPTRLGTINHTLLTVEALRSRNLPVAGLVLNGPPDPGLVEVLHQFLPPSVRVVAEIEPAPELRPGWVAEMGPRAFADFHP